jgi:N-formylglutamate amidohydrolase
MDIQHPAQNITPSFSIHEPAEHKAPVIFNAPHAGNLYSQDFLNSSRLGSLALRRSEDAHVDKLYAGVVQLGAPLMVAHFPRAYLDLNREPYELDPRLFNSKLPSYANARSVRVAGGLGTIPRVVGEGQDIYPGRITLEEGLGRIEALHKPYHRALQNRLNLAAAKFGAVLLIDCHSMPTPSAKPGQSLPPDIVLGDRFGRSCSAAITGFLEQAFQARDYRVARNRPYAGGYITEHYGQPANGRHAIQIEISRALYMNEFSLEPTANFVRLAQDLVAIAAQLMRMAPTLLSSMREAAE